MKTNAQGVHYRDLNEQIRAAVQDGVEDIVLDDVRGHRYIGTGLPAGVRITINGIPGNDLAAFMNGAELVVNGNAQDGVGNTMNGGKVVIRGTAGDILGHSMRGGKILVRDNVGYRTGIHMKAYEGRFPIVVIGGNAKDYLGEYMAGGILAVLGIGCSNSPAGSYVGTGMHGGLMFIRGRIEPHQLGREVGLGKVDESDWAALKPALDEFCGAFGHDVSEFKPADFVKLSPQTTRPYGKLYAY